MSGAATPNDVPARNTIAESSSPDSPRARTQALVALALAVIIGLPIFLRMPLTNDPVYYDLQAQLIQNGGVLYRDMMEPNFPGVVWLHRAVRATWGGSSEALRLVDFLLFSGSVATLAFALRRAGGTRASAIWLAGGMVWFYFSLVEWSHCQRDAWLLLPTGLAMMLRERQLDRLRSGASTRSIFLAGILEGAVWGCGVWIKPHIMLAASAVWIAGAFLARQPRRAFTDLLGLLVGGGLIGAVGSVWLISSGTWPYFWETLIKWNPLYAQAMRNTWRFSFFVGMLGRFFPWVLIHFLTIPISIRLIWQTWKARRSAVASDSLSGDDRRALWSVLYLVWLLQASFLQILFDYVFVPPQVLAMLVLVMWLNAKPWPAFRILRVTAVVFAALWPLLWHADQCRLWPHCLTKASTPELRNQLRRVQDPDWEDLERVAQFLDQQYLKSGDLICFQNHLIHLYPRLRIQPTIRFVYQATYVQIVGQNQSKRENELRNLVERDFLDHPPRFIVSDLHSAGLPPSVARSHPSNEPLGFPPEFPAALRKRMPWRYPVIFRSGGMLVHAYPRKELDKPAVEGTEAPIAAPQEKN